MSREELKYPKSLTELPETTSVRTAMLVIDDYDDDPEMQKRITFAVNVGIIAGKKAAEDDARRFITERMVNNYSAWLNA